MVEAQTAAASGKRSWVAVLLGYAGRCRGKMAASLAASVASVAMGFVPFYAVYRIMEIVMGASGGEGGAGAWEAAVPWIAAAAAAYVASKVLFGVSTLLSHVSAYTILAQLRRDFAAKLMRASLGTVQGKSIGQIKNVFIDRIEGIEPPLAHMIPELSGSFLRYCPDSCANSSRRLPAVGMVTRPAETRPGTFSIPTRCRPRT